MSLEMFIVIYCFVGVLAGLLGGMLGIGGGSITVPCLIALFSIQDFPKDIFMHLVIGTSLAAAACNAAAATYFHSRHRNMYWPLIGKIAPGALIGAITAAFVIKNISSVFLEVFFALFALYVSWSFFRPFSHEHTDKKHPPGYGIFTLFGTGIGLLSNLLGGGGGVFVIPLLTYYRFPPKKIIGTAAFTSFIVSTTGTCLLLDSSSVTISSSYGYVYLPAFIPIACSSMISALWGTHLTNTLPISILRKIFASIMLLTSLSIGLHFFI